MLVASRWADNDLCWFLMLTMSTMVALITFWQEGVIQETEKYLPPSMQESWQCINLRWEKGGCYGNGVYGDLPGLTKKSIGTPLIFARNCRSVSPSLAVFIFQPLDLNLIDCDTLQVIRGVGPKMANAIINYRITHGQFRLIDELIKVKGIGPIKLSLLRSHLVIY